MKTRFLLLSLAALLLAAPARADLQVRISVKFILGSSGQRPSNSGPGFGSASVALTSDQAVVDNIAYANELLRRSGRGYQYVLTEIQDVSGWSSFFSIPARNGPNKNALEDVATSNATTRAQFFWRDNAINVYINNTSSGVCSFPDDGYSAIFIGSSAYDTLIIHESGHYFNLYHTHQGEDYLNSNGTDCSAADCTCAQLIGGTGDMVADTISDHQCWTRAQLVSNNPGATQTQIDNVWTNIMSYHLPQDHFTSDQLDRWTDAANSSRNGSVVGAGHTRFVDRANNTGFEFGTSGLPFNTVSEGVGAANSGDTVLVRIGHYDQPQTITKAVTLRASRGTVIIGIP